MANTSDPPPNQSGASTSTLVVNQARPITSQGDCSQSFGSESLPLIIATQPGITYEISPLYYTPFQHMSRSVPAILFPNLSEFSTPPNVGGTSQTLVLPNLPPLAREQIIQSLNAQLQLVQQQILFFTQGTTDAPTTGTSTPKSVLAIGAKDDN